MTLPRGDGEVVSNTRVAVRVRPMTNIERDLGAGRCLNISGGNRVACSDARTWNSEDFTFDHAWELDETQEEVYAAIGEPALRAAWDGYDVGVMAYGQTGTGKTYTLWGDDRGRDDRGRRRRRPCAVMRRRRPPPRER